MTTVFDIRYWRLAVVAASACLASALAGCADEGDGPLPVPEEGEVAEVPVTITFGTAWEQDGATRVPPPGQEADPDKIDGWYETNADKVRIVTFRRKDMDDQLQGQVNDAPFIYDPTNDYTVDCVKPEVKPENGYFTAKASLRKVYGYEYRVVALAYDSKRDNSVRTGGTFPDGEQNLFTIILEDGTTFDSFKATLRSGDVWQYLKDMNDKATTNERNNCINGKTLFVPEFFYGYCRADGSDSDIIKFAERGSDGEYNKGIPLTGILYRGVAKIVMTVGIEQFDAEKPLAAPLAGPWTISSCALMATNANTVVCLSSYDGFLTPSSPLEDWDEGGLLESAHDLYTVIDYQNVSDAADGGREVVFTAFVLPAKMKLAMRFLASLTYVLDYESIFNGSIHVANTSYADGATGVIMPDVDGNEFYFRRNHKYVFRGNSSSILADDNRLD